ncbi:SDR family oxidoreductase [Sagittula sp. NFXS13]|uniref:glucose 1-dehydrogenase n=1 Tax=Sagittula sp. NFXS13 TaxID=2819095 RepID=UPI0032DE6628
MTRLAGKTALITGAAMGMGAAVARMFVEEGANVVLADVAEDEGRQLAKDLGDERALFVLLDVTDPAAWEAAVAATTERFGQLNILVNNAGIFNTGSLEDYPLETWHQTIAINLTGPFLGLRAARDALVAGVPSSVINISSTAGLQGYPGFYGYSASKWGVRGLTRSAALELADVGIRVNSVHPGGVATPLMDGVAHHPGSDPGASSLNRLARPEEIGNLILFLASDEASYCTGSEYVADGGHTAGVIP